MKVEAIEPGYFGVLRMTGEEFEVPDGEVAPWWKPVKKGRKGSTAEETQD